MAWILFFIAIIFMVWLFIKFVKWLTSPSYVHKVGNIYYKTGNKELTVREREKLRKMNEKLRK